MNCALTILLPDFPVGTIYRAPTLPFPDQVEDRFVYFLGNNHNILLILSKMFQKYKGLFCGIPSFLGYFKGVSFIFLITRRYLS